MFQEVASRCTSYLVVLEVGEYVYKTDPRPCVISITWLCDARVCVPELSDERVDPYEIFNHG